MPDHAQPAAGDDLTLALRLATLADRLTLEAYRSRDLVVETKPDLTPVTNVDRAVEVAIREELTAVRPGDAVVGEEYGPIEGAAGSARRWIIDPIDGTKNFVRGIPVWATLLALEEEGTIRVGVASAPALGRRWWAGAGTGAWTGSVGGDRQVPARAVRRMRVSSVHWLGDAQLSYSSLSGWSAHGGPGRLLDLAGRCWRTRAFGDFWSHVLVAEGACEIGLDPEVSIWDLAALQVIVEEAGGRFTDLSGAARADGGSAVSTNGLVHDEVLAILGG
jgi:histidinol-phosphatase